MQALVYPGRGTRPDWNNPDILQRERLPAHAYLVPFPDLASCRHAVSDNRRLLSPYIIRLSGVWDYRCYPSILQLPENILSFRSGFDQRLVPEQSCYQSGSLAGGLPFPINPPHLTPEQPVLVYRRTVRLPLLWGSLRKHLVLQGVRSACHIFINGRLAGYTQGSCLPARFDLTNGLHDGDNELFILAYPFSSGSYLETQPVQALAGLVRDVYLEAVPAIALHDLRVTTVWLAEEEAWRLDLHIQLISCRLAPDQPTVRVLLHQDRPLQEQCWTVSMKPVSKPFTAPIQTVGTLNISMLVAGVAGWSDEQPNLVDLFVTVEDRSGRDLVSVHQSVGFRMISHRDNQLLLNGRPLKLRGVRWSCLGEPDLLLDLGRLVRRLCQFKRNHLNMIYFADVPPDPIVLELCDMLGFCVVLECPVSGVNGPSGPALALFGPQALLLAAEDRVERLIRRDGNHACVIAWSVGLFAPEALMDRSSLVDKLAEQMRTWDPQRLLHGLDIPWLTLSLDGWLQHHDAVQTADTDWLADAAAQPGCCLTDTHLPDSLLQAIGVILRPLDIAARDALTGEFVVTNRLVWTPATAFRVAWQLLRQGKPILSGELDGIKAAPGESQAFSLWYGEQSFHDGNLYSLQFQISMEESTLWACAGDWVSSQEFMLIGGAPALALPIATGGRLRLESDRHHLIVSGPRFWLVFNRLNATLESWRTGDKELLASANGKAGLAGFVPIMPAGLRCQLDRPAEPLDRPDRAHWLAEGYDRLLTHVLAVDEGCDGQMAVIDMMARLGAAGRPSCFDLALRYEVRSSGELRLFASLTPLQTKQLPPPCFSFVFNPKKSFQSFAWFGSGPERQSGRLILPYVTGLHEQTGDSVLQPDQTEGCWTGVRYLTVKDDSGFGLLIRSDDLFAFDVRTLGSAERSGVPGLAEANRPLRFQIFHLPSLACRPIGEPLRMTLSVKPVVESRSSL